MGREELKRELIERIEIQSSFRELQEESIKIVNELVDGFKSEIVNELVEGFKSEEIDNQSNRSTIVNLF